MMKTIRQHIPNFVSVDGPLPEAQFETLQELLEIPFVKRWAESPNFHRFSLSKYMLMGNANLLVELRGGREWWVVGAIDDSTGIDLPQWDGGIYEVEIDGVPQEIPGSMVEGSKGSVVRLKDGRNAVRRRG